MGTHWVERQKLAGNRFLKALRQKPRSESESSDPFWMIAMKTNLVMSHPSLTSFELLHILIILRLYHINPPTLKKLHSSFANLPRALSVLAPLFLLFPVWFMPSVSPAPLVILQTSAPQFQPQWLLLEGHHCSFKKIHSFMTL